MCEFTKPISETFVEFYYRHLNRHIAHFDHHVNIFVLYSCSQLQIDESLTVETVDRNILQVDSTCQQSESRILNMSTQGRNILF